MDQALVRSRFERDYVFIAALFAVLMVLTNIIGTKLFLLFPEWLPQGFGHLTSQGYVVLTTGLVTYPLTFLFTDICSEIWGRKRANYMVFLGFVASLLMLAVVHIAVGLPRADRYWADAARQPQHGTTLLEPAAAGSTALQVDDAQHLVLGPQEARGLLAVMVADPDGITRPVVLSYTGLVPPLQRISGPDGAQTAPLRWDLRGSLKLAEPLARELPAGCWVVPAARISAAGEDTLILDGAHRFPSTGQAALANGAVVSWQGLGPGGQMTTPTGAVYGSPAQPGPADLAVGVPLALVGARSPADLQQSYSAVFAAPGILLVASMLAYLVAQFLDVGLYHFWRRVTGPRHLWLRNNGSTMISQLVDTILVNGIFLPIAFGMGVWPVVQVIIAVYIVKMVLAWLDTPLIYLGVWIAKRRLGLRWDQEPDRDLLGTEAGYGSWLARRRS